MSFRTQHSLALMPSLFAAFAALAAPGFAPGGDPVDLQLALDPGDDEAELDEPSQLDLADVEEPGDPVEGVERQNNPNNNPNNNPHNPDPQSPACKKNQKKKNEPDGCPGPF